VTSGLVVGADGAARCAWAGQTPDYAAYHDHEWGRPVHGETALLERFTLEAFQSGLSWLTILRKREGFRRAFAGFDAGRVAAFGADDEARLLADASIVRNGAKIRAAIGNARATVALRAEDGLDALVWAFAPDPLPRRPRSPAQARSTSPESVALAASLHRKGFSFVGPTTAYAAMQACGLVDDHVQGCHVVARC